MTAGHPLALGIELDGEGSHPAAWRRAGHPPDRFFDPRRLTALAETAERAGFTFATFEDDIVAPGRQPDVVGRIGPVERAAFLTPSLSVLAVVPGVSTTYSEPFHVSTHLASIDHLSQGRAGWLVSSSPEPAAAQVWGRPPVESAWQRRREAADSIEVVRALWDSWRLRSAGRPEDDIRILPGSSIIVAPTDSEARDKAEWARRQQVTPRTALAQAGLIWNLDLSDRDADGPLPKDDPNPPDLSGAFGAGRVADARATVAQWRAASEANGWSLRETVLHLGRRAGGHVGSPATLADKFARFVRHGALDGFNLSPHIVPHGLDDIVDLLIPELQERGLYPAEYQGTTLREHLGLRPSPVVARAEDHGRAG
jgi:alkanesulfonate monooxygenase SsuD/methylene tetrahydromethanopterin reductase-like flavin-dependent oxidoreductase (luciferase family)